MKTLHVAGKQFPRANVSSHPHHHGQTWEVKKLVSCTQIAIDTLQGHENTACCKQAIPANNNNNTQYLFGTCFQGRCCPDSKTFHPRGRGLLKITSSGSMLDVIHHLPMQVAILGVVAS